MSNWRSLLRADATGWLLENDNPSVRYFTLTDILEKLENDPEVNKAKKEIMESGVAPNILAQQKNEDHWGVPTTFYTAKYKGTVWQLLILAELGADGKDGRIRKACEFILENSQDRESGGFSPWLSVNTGGGRHAGVIPCLTGNMIWSLIRFGYFSDPRVQRGIDWIVKYQRFDDGVKETAKGWPYEKAVMCFGKHSCHMGVVKALKALAEIPREKRSMDVNKTIERGSEYVLQHRIHKKSHNLSQVSKPGWLHFGFPLMYQTDALEILGILTNLGFRDNRMQEAVDLVVSKQDEQGRWELENTFNGKFQVSIEQKGKPSKWITLNALRVLRRFYG
jgi:hypothetical protein